MKSTIRGIGPLILMLILMVPAMPAAASGDGEADGRGPFVDTDGSVHESSVAALWAAGITAGCDEWRYCPDEPVTRGQMAAFLTRSFGLNPEPEVSFSDAESSRFADEITALASADITEGCDDDRYCPRRPVTRAQMATFLARALELPPVSSDRFADDDDSVHEANIEALAAAGITHGCGDGRFCPDEPVTRAQLAAFLARALHLPVPDQLPAIPDDVREEHEVDRLSVELYHGDDPARWRPLVEQFFRPGDVDRALRVLACESLGDPEARNPSSGASGLFQHLPRYWEERSTKAGYAGASIFDPEANVAVAAWLLYEDGGWKHWVCKG